MLESISKFIEELLANSNFANGVAFSAFGISTIGLIWTRRAAQTSHQALVHAQAEAAKSERLETEKKRFELLCAISNEKAQLMTTGLELGVLKANHDADSQAVKAMLKNFSQIFDYLPQIESSISQLDQLYSEIVTLAPSDGPVGLLKLAAEKHRLSKETEFFIKCCTDSLPTFNEKRQQAIYAQHFTPLPDENA
ncbi:hypothetical protein [Geothrix terrae]|uniref:hypothetical protein n=1 Tax=Geothrix terrae TaxID=2922720 RepID=UPI001FABB0D9|nr:hypothetical protein [Geothrix terrae]